MKAPSLVAAVLAVLAASASCQKDDPQSNGALADASFDAPGGRQVVEDIPDGFFTPRDTTEVPPVTSGSPPVGGGGGDAAGGAVDARPPDTAPRDLAGESATAGCDLLRQSCGDSQGCYLGPDGRTGVCRLAGGSPELFECNQHEECLPGLLCASGFVGSGTLCLRICDPRTGNTCPGMKGCRTYPGTQVGTCAP